MQLEDDHEHAYYIRRVQSINQSIKNLQWIVQSTAVTVQRKLKIRKRKRKEICLLKFRFQCWQCCRRCDFRGKRVCDAAAGKARSPIVWRCVECQ